MPIYPKHIVTYYTRPYKEDILEKLGYRKAEESVETPEFKMEHVRELISRGTIPLHFVREADGILYLHKDAVSILGQAYQALHENESHEEADEIANSDVVSELERNFNRLVDLQIEQLKNLVAMRNNEFDKGCEGDEKALIECCRIRKDLTELRKLYGR